MKHYVHGVLLAVAKKMMNSDKVFPQVQGIARTCLVGMADSHSRGQSYGIQNDYERRAFLAMPELVSVLDIGHGSENAVKIYQQEYGLSYPF